jgi:hypothetical protein
MSQTTSPDGPASATDGNRLRDTLTGAVLFLTTAAFTLWQNTRVAVLFDLSYLLDSSYRISLGQLPYRDFPFAHAPLPFLLHAAIIRLFGPIYYPHILCAALEAGLATLLTWRILLKIGVPHDRRALNLSKGEAIVGKVSSPKSDLANPFAGLWFQATLLASPLTVLGIYAVYPHPIYDSDCILAVLLALFLLQRAADRPIRNAVAGAACILPLFSKQNIGLPFLLITLSAGATIATFRRLNQITIVPQLYFFAGASATFAAALLLLHATAGLHNYIHWTVTFAAQRRLPGLSVMLETYRQTSLLWTIPAAIAGLILLRRQAPETPTATPGARFTARPRRNMTEFLHRPVAYLLLALPFLWAIADLAFTADPDDRADQFLSLWPHLLLVAGALALYQLRPNNLRAAPTMNTLFPIILLVTIHGAFLSQQLWGSTYALWPLLTLLVAAMLSHIPSLARPLAITIASTFLLRGGLYATSLERLDYIHLDGAITHATLPQFRGLSTPGPWIPGFEELVRITNAELPAGDGILLLPGEDPFYFATDRIPQFPVLLFAPATDPYTPQQVLDQARIHNIRWLIVKRNLQLTDSPESDLPEVLTALQQDFSPYRTLTDYDIYRRK